MARISEQKLVVTVKSVENVGQDTQITGSNGFRFLVPSALLKSAKPPQQKQSVVLVIASDDMAKVATEVVTVRKYEGPVSITSARVPTREK